MKPTSRTLIQFIQMPDPLALGIIQQQSLNGKWRRVSHPASFDLARPLVPQRATKPPLAQDIWSSGGCALSYCMRDWDDEGSRPVRGRVLGRGAYGFELWGAAHA